MLHFFAKHISVIADMHPAVQCTLAWINHRRGCSQGPARCFFLSSFGAMTGAIAPGSSALEEAVLFLGIAESVRTRMLGDFFVHMGDTLRSSAAISPDVEGRDAATSICTWLYLGMQPICCLLNHGHNPLQ